MGFKMKKISMLFSILLTGCLNPANANTGLSSSVSGKFSVHCYFGGEVVLTSEAKRATYLNGAWKIQDIDNSEYETSAMCIAKKN